MEDFLSKSEKKRRSKNVEKLVFELIELAGSDIERLPCPPVFKDEIGKAKKLKDSARKRQVKYIAKMLRQKAEIIIELMRFLEISKGSKLKEASELHELEKLRDAIINEVLAHYGDATVEGRLPPHRLLEKLEFSDALSEVLSRFPELEIADLQKAAIQFVRTRNKVYGRQIFRILKAALERQKYSAP